MDRAAFWQIIEAARSNVGGSMEDADEVAGEVTALLVTMSPEEIIGFAAVFDDLQRESYRWDLWAAAYLLNGGCSDDGFDYFRGWLVAQGPTVWEAALADPDSLAGLVDPDAAAEGDLEAECEDMLYVASTAYERAMSRRKKRLGRRKPAELPRTDPQPDRPSGDDFDFDDDAEMRRRLPRLFALFGGADGG